MDTRIKKQTWLWSHYLIKSTWLMSCLTADKSQDSVTALETTKLPLPLSYAIRNQSEVKAFTTVRQSIGQSSSTVNHRQMTLYRIIAYDSAAIRMSDDTTNESGVTTRQSDTKQLSDSQSPPDGRGRNITSIYNATQLLDNLLQSYDNRLRPGFGGPPTEVDVNLNIRSMGPISERDMSYQMDCYFRQNWIDKRLTFDGPLDIMPVSINILERIWKPDTHFLNGRRSLLHTVTSPNKLLRIYKNGTILYSMRLTIKASCPMYLENFPMDTQTCPLRFGSHGYNTDDVVYIWTHGPHKSITIPNDMTLSQFDLIGFPHTNENVTQTHNRFGQFSILSVRFTLRRHMGYFLINVYVPCSLLVICSWVGFWINREATSDRIALGVTTVLTMAFLKIENRSDLPEVSYSTALDYFLGTCFALILATIIEFAGVHFFTKHGSGEIQTDSEYEEDEALADHSQQYERSDNNGHTYSLLQRKVNQSSNSQNSDNNGAYFSPEQLRCQAFLTHTPAKRRQNEKCCYKFWNCVKGSSKYRSKQMRRPSTNTSSGTNSVSKIDIVSRLLFPFLFAVFNAVYWSLYIAYGDNEVLM